jgi:hypothetical protein
MIGVAAAVVTVAFIVVRLFQAATPVPTPVSVLNLTSVPVTVEELSVAGVGVMMGAHRPPSGASGASATHVPDATVDLAVGRRLEVRARILGPESLVASCSPEPRPYGDCSLKVAFRGTSELQCEFECRKERGD